ncbi:hypothetical protein AFLA_010513 [Aspergillus flavus NRRL3357]|nr:hypothetical protein AFLA_010513 [Aspergillus flavus NRRL3357]
MTPEPTRLLRSRQVVQLLAYHSFRDISFENYPVTLCYIILVGKDQSLQINWWATPVCLLRPRRYSINLTSTIFLATLIGCQPLCRVPYLIFVLRPHYSSPKVSGLIPRVH